MAAPGANKTRDRKRRFVRLYRQWNRRVHIWLGLYMVLFLWVFAVSGLFMNHPDWFAGQPERSVVEQAIVMPETGTDLDRAHDLMGQLNLQGEVVFRGEMPAGKFNFMALRPNLRQFVSVDVATSNATVRRADLSAAGTLGELHTFTGVRGIYGERRSVRDWLPTRVWSIGMDALSVGLILIVLSSLYMAWRRWRAERVGVIVSLVAGVGVAVYFMWGLAWMASP